MKYTKYEKARTIGARALQLAMGAPFMLRLSQQELEKIRYSTVEIAKLEFGKGVIPLTLKRPYPKLNDAGQGIAKHAPEMGQNEKQIFSGHEEM